ncbi:MAG: prepilin-type N-terminal cleavage/methylation domain-containing protein [Phycisphaeraceae bacterium]|nr:prepilin-type N-terminal cleavage/methylation domain-containing protein [Phycisphaeraceae bacterium]
MHAIRQRSAGAFTLVEILIVVVILGILAAIVVPQFTSASEETRANAVKMDLHRIRQQIEIYKSQHDDPPTVDGFVNQMTLSSDANGDTAAIGTDGYPFGPYLATLPFNPYTKTNDVVDISEDVGSSAWAYDETDGTFVANSDEEHREW